MRGNYFHFVYKTGKNPSFLPANFCYLLKKRMSTLVFILKIFSSVTGYRTKGGLWHLCATTSFVLAGRVSNLELN